ncbi:hypothetical protein EDB86DRAFT_2828689 [Lactarius hatsudake]|nr:hypothetical protein EDB86DRAFT_2828689 [Lactarius hatsudake]
MARKLEEEEAAGGATAQDERERCERSVILGTSDFPPGDLPLQDSLLQNIFGHHGSGALRHESGPSQLVHHTAHDEQHVWRISTAHVDLAQSGSRAVTATEAEAGEERTFLRRSGMSAGMSVAVYLRTRGSVRVRKVPFLHCSFLIEIINQQHPRYWEHAPEFEDVRLAELSIFEQVVQQRHRARRCRDDNTLVGAAVATFSIAGQALTGLDWTLGTEVLPFDAEVFGIAKTVEALAMFYTEEVAPPDHYFIFSSSSSALQAVRNPRNRTAQKHALIFHQSLTTISLLWTPVDENLEGQQVARHRAVEACKRDPPQGLDRVQSAAFQKDRARRRAFQQWNDKWLANNLIPEFNRRVLGAEALSHHLRYLITQPPSHDKHHPLWTAATDMECDANGKKTKTLKFTRRTTSTALQVATDHAFTGTSARRFRPSDPPETTSCPCGEATRSAEHVLLHCPRFVQPRISFAHPQHGVEPYPPPPPIPPLLPHPGRS